jgi:cyclopropane-fatty-acyl-phospholipid synthase
LSRGSREQIGGLPVALRFWDGSELPAALAASADTLVVREPTALVGVLRDPGELGLARAWVAGELDLEGDLERALRMAEQLREIRPSRATEPP